MNLFTVLVGVTSKGRKGSSWGQVLRLFTETDPEWAGGRVISGLSSGEGLIWAVRDKIEKEEPVREKGKVRDYQTVIVDHGVTDKRLMVFEPEFASTLQVIRREGNTLSPGIRQAWDTGNLRVMAKNSPANATGAHISLVVHITKEELHRHLERMELFNGFANRFLWVAVRRSKCLPEGGHVQAEVLSMLIQQLREAVAFGQIAGDLKKDEEARALWGEVYEGLSQGRPGLLGAVTSRAEAQVMRLACIYALMDQSFAIGKVHLTAALALWKYAEASCRFIFGEALGDPTADELLRALRGRPKGLSRTEIHELFGRNRPAQEITRALGVLAEYGLASQSVVPTGGRATEQWVAVRSAADAPTEETKDTK